MAGNPIKGEVAFSCEGVTYQLVFSIDSLCALEDRLNLGIQEIGERMGNSPRVSFLRSVFHAGLSEHHPKVTERQAGEMFKHLGFQRVGELIGEAFSKAFGKPEADDDAEAAEGEADPQPAPTEA